MKDIFRTLPVIAVMTTVAACSGGIEEQNPNGPATGDKIRIEFTAENPGTGIGPTPAAETRTSIHIGDGSFVSRWDDGNEMTLLYGSMPPRRLTAARPQNSRPKSPRGRRISTLSRPTSRTPMPAASSRFRSGTCVRRTATTSTTATIR